MPNKVPHLNVAVTDWLLMPVLNCTHHKERVGPISDSPYLYCLKHLALEDGIKFSVMFRFG